MKVVFILAALTFSLTALASSKDTKAKEKNRKPNAVQTAGNGPLTVTCDDGAGNV